VQQLPEHWKKRFCYRPLLVETFVE
jgi:hypothetical protein